MMQNQEFYDDTYISIVAGEYRGNGIHLQIEFLRNFVLGENKSAAIFDQCCGHGRHLKGLAEYYTNLTGMDINEHFISLAARELSSSIRLQCCNIFDADDFGKFDFIINMESSVASFSKTDLQHLFKHNNQLLKSQGILLIHVFNPVYVAEILPRKTWQATSFGNFIMESRHIDQHQSTLEISQVRMLRNDGGSYDAYASNITQTMHSQREILDYAAQSGFSNNGLFGGFDGSRYDERESTDMIFLFSKK